ncbi:Importin subunit alpha-2 [Hibiscus syriacus]|uniref:Importin subunit alpha-2 n=1 Tax=Hibiscus syriacus TaxID=106335 RepID=A0A6A3C1W2_HIBSY|nr:Importin subunit alpha-2 [Hibiscus syriacus]
MCSIPDTVKSKYHRHPLTLTDSFVEDDSGLYTIVKNVMEENVSYEGSFLKKRREGLQPQPIQLENVPAMVIGVWSDDANLQLKATAQFRELLSVEKSPPIDQVIQVGAVPRFVEFLKSEDLPQLQFEAAWVLTNIASGTFENTKVVIDHGAVPIFIKLLGSPNDDVYKQALSYLSYATTNDRIQTVIEASVCGRLMELLLHPSLSVLKPALLTVGNIRTVRDGVAAHASICQRSGSTNVMETYCREHVVAELDCCVAFDVNAHSAPNMGFEGLKNVETDAFDVNAYSTVNLCLDGQYGLKSMESDVAVIEADVSSSGSSTTKWFLVSRGCFKTLCDLLDCRGPSIIEVSLTGLENILSIGVGGAARAISNAISHETRDHIRFLVNHGCIKPLCDLLIHPDPSIAGVCLQVLENIMEVGEDDKIKGAFDSRNVRLLVRM